MGFQGILASEGAFNSAGKYYHDKKNEEGCVDPASSKKTTASLFAYRGLKIKGNKCDDCFN